MKDTKKILRHAIFAALDGAVIYDGNAVPVVDEKLRNNAPATLYIILGTQQETSIERNSSTWIKQSSIDIEVIERTGTEVSKDAVNDVGELITEILLPTINTIGIAVPTGFQFSEAYVESASTATVILDNTESIVVERIRLAFIITQQ